MTEQLFPELASLKADECFVEAIRIVKGGKFHIMNHGVIIKRSQAKDMIIALKSQLNAEKIYLVTIEK